MRRVLKISGLGLIAAIAVLLAVTVIAGRERMLEFVLGPVEFMAIDFATLKKTPKPNQYLVCPPNFCAEKPDRESPEFEFGAATLSARWQAMAARQPRTSQTASDPASRQIEYVQRSWLFRFPDTVTVQFVPLGAGRSTLAVYSRSHYGHSDMGVNAKRVETWLAAIDPDPIVP